MTYFVIDFGYAVRCDICDAEFDSTRVGADDGENRICPKCIRAWRMRAVS